MKIALLGASGRTGLRFIPMALERGFEVRALARTPSSLGAFAGKVQVVQGDATDPTRVRELIGGCEAVVSALGAASIRESGLHVRAMPVVAAAMREAGVRRYVGLNSAAAFLPSDKPGLGLQLMKLGRWVVPGYFADKKAEVDAVVQADLEWTLLRAGPLTDDAGEAYRAELDTLASGVRAKTSRAAVARAMIDALAEKKWVRQAPYVLSA